jgi:hypothetical protein
MTERRPVEPETSPLLEALVALARSAIANRREAARRRGKMTAIQGGAKKGGRAA